jgi:hypothetical protein
MGLEGVKSTARCGTEEVEQRDVLPEQAESERITSKVTEGSKGFLSIGVEHSITWSPGKMTRAQAAEIGRKAVVSHLRMLTQAVAVGE